MSSTTFSGPVTSTAGFIGYFTSSVVNLTAATLTVTPALHASKTVTVNAAAATAITLPAASGTGDIYTFFIGTTITSNSTTIKVANASDTMAGKAIVETDGASDLCIAFSTAAASDTITLNGTTTGGLLGDQIVIQDVAANVFSVMVHTSATGTEATPFSATV